jgi:hypothetical protein
MKRKIFLAWVGAAVMVSSCDQLLDQATVTDSGNYNTELTIVPGALGDHLYVQKLVEADLQQMIADNGHTGVTVKRINITSAIIEITPDSRIRNFNAINVLNAIIETDLLPADTIATYVNTIIGATALTLDPMSVDVADYLGSSQYALAIDGTLKEALTDTLKVNFKVTYDIVLGLIGSSSH